MNLNTKIKKILIATNNKAKLKEIKFGLKEIEKLSISLLTLNDVQKGREVAPPKETGESFCENAVIKAKYYGKLFNLPTIADDGGLTIPFLNNQPGVKSRRWLGYEATDEELITFTLKKLKKQPLKNRKAFLTTCLCFYHPYTNKYFLSEGKIKGFIADKPSLKRIAGYPFRALFIVDKFNKYYDELTEKEHQQVNHRLRALRKIVKIIKTF